MTTTYWWCLSVEAVQQTQSLLIKAAARRTRDHDVVTARTSFSEVRATLDVIVWLLWLVCSCQDLRMDLWRESNL